MGSLRTLLAVSVLITHSDSLFGVRLLAGDTAVTCFFVISGFLITLILREKYVDNVKAFYVNRFLRIYVPYWAALVFSIVLIAVIATPEYDPFGTYDRVQRAGGNDWWTAWSGVSNLTLIGVDLTRYIQITDGLGGMVFPNFMHEGTAGGTELLFVPQAWTLGIELQFYLLAPFLVRRLNAFWLLVVTAGLFVFTVKLYDDLRTAGVVIDPSAIFAMQLQYFLAGAVAYHGYRYLRDWPVPPAAKRALSIAVTLLAFVMVFRGYELLRPHPYRTHTYFYAGFAATLPFAFYLTRDWRWDSRVGDYSYPIYIFHFAVNIGVGAWITKGEWRGEWTLLWTVVVCTVFLYTIDGPLQRLRRRIAQRAGAEVPATADERALGPVPGAAPSPAA